MKILQDQMTSSSQTDKYNDETATTLARRLLDGATDETRIAVVSAPSAFIQLKNLLVCVHEHVLQTVNTDVLFRHRENTSANRN